MGSIGDGARLDEDTAGFHEEERDAIFGDVCDAIDIDSDGAEGRAVVLHAATPQ